MQVYTTIFLAEKLPVNHERAEEAGAPDEATLNELENSPRECIVTLESRNWFVEDDLDR